MIAPFGKKYTDYIIVAVSVVPILAQVLLSGIGATALCANWIASGLFAWMIWNIIEVNHLGIFKRNHAFPISWALISMVLNFALINFNEYKDGTLAAERWYDIDKFQWYYLIQMLGLLLIIMTMMQTWQNKIATLPLIFCGLITGAVSTLLNYSLFWLLFFPIILYQLLSLLSGFAMSVDSFCSESTMPTSIFFHTQKSSTTLFLTILTIPDGNGCS